jgi:hypothetical protein
MVTLQERTGMEAIYHIRFLFANRNPAVGRRFSAYAAILAG